MRIPLLVIVLLCGLLSLCNEIPVVQKNSVESVIEDKRYPAVLFTKRYINHAKGYRHGGWYIDEQGYVDTFSYSLEDSSWLVIKKDIVSQEDLKKMLIKSKTDSRKIDASKLDSMVSLVRLAAKGTLSLPTNRCNDYGVVSYTAFIYDSTSLGYREILLYEMGDWARKNGSDAAEQLTRWLLSIDSVSIDDAPCKPE